MQISAATLAVATATTPAARALNRASTPVDALDGLPEGDRKPVLAKPPRLLRGFSQDQLRGATGRRRGLGRPLVAPSTLAAPATLLCLFISLDGHWPSSLFLRLNRVFKVRKTDYQNIFLCKAKSRRLPGFFDLYKPTFQVELGGFCVKKLRA